MSQYPKVIRDGQPSEALVFYCCDPDFKLAFEKFIKNMGLGKYDSYSRPAPSKTLAEDPSAINEIKKLHGLHKFDRLVLLDHIDCGGFGIDDESEETQSHFKYFNRDKTIIERELPGVQFEPFIIGWEKEIKQTIAN